jgi:hypothetical protein
VEADAGNLKSPKASGAILGCPFWSSPGRIAEGALKDTTDEVVAVVIAEVVERFLLVVGVCTGGEEIAGFEMLFSLSLSLSFSEEEILGPRLKAFFHFRLILCAGLDLNELGGTGPAGADSGCVGERTVPLILDEDETSVGEDICMAPRLVPFLSNLTPGPLIDG